MFKKDGENLVLRLFSDLYDTEYYFVLVPYGKKGIRVQVEDKLRQLIAWQDLDSIDLRLLANVFNDYAENPYRGFTEGNIDALQESKILDRLEAISNRIDELLIGRKEERVPKEPHISPSIQNDHTPVLEPPKMCLDCAGFGGVLNNKCVSCGR